MFLDGLILAVVQDQDYHINNMNAIINKTSQSSWQDDIKHDGKNKNKFRMERKGDDCGELSVIPFSSADGSLNFPILFFWTYDNN